MNFINSFNWLTGVMFSLDFGAITLSWRNFKAVFPFGNAVTSILRQKRQRSMNANNRGRTFPSKIEVELEYFIPKLYMKHFYSSIRVHISTSYLNYILPCAYQEWPKRPDGHLIGILFSASQPPCSTARHKIDCEKGQLSLTAMNAERRAET